MSKDIKLRKQEVGSCPMGLMARHGLLLLPFMSSLPVNTDAFYVLPLHHWRVQVHHWKFGLQLLGSSFRE